MTDLPTEVKQADVMRQPKGVTLKQWLWVLNYVISKNATEAAKLAGYSLKTAKQIGTENLAKPALMALVEVELEKHVDSLEITAERVLREIAKLAFSNYADILKFDQDGRPVIDLQDLHRDQYAALQEVTTTTRKLLGKDYDDDGAEVTNVKVKLADKGVNLERLGRHLELFTDKMKHSGKIEVTELSDDQLDARLKALTGQ